MSLRDRVLQSAKALHDSRNYAAAAKTLEQFLHENEGTPEMYLLYAWSIIAIDFEYGRKAAQALEKGLALYPDHEELLVTLGHIYMVHLNEYEKALTCYEAVLAHKPNSIGAHLGIAALYPWGVTAERAIEHLNTVIEQDPEVQDVYTRIGTIYWYERDYEKALHWFEEALKHNVANREGVEKSIQEIRERLGERPAPAE